MALRVSEQIRLEDIVKPEDVAVDQTILESDYYNDQGMPVAPKNFRSLMKRNGGKKVWVDAMLLEREQLKERGVFEFVTLAELRQRGYPKPIHMQCLFCASAPSAPTLS
eukprot:COSAG02_NODE_4205_length_5628_cov_3.597938_5_plen_109_part_00